MENIGFRDSENGNEAKPILMDPITISIGRSHGVNNAMSLVTFYMCEII